MNSTKRHKSKVNTIVSMIEEADRESKDILVLNIIKQKRPAKSNL